MLRLERDGYARQMAKRVMRQLAVNGQRRVRHDLWKWMGGVAAAVAIIVCAVVWSLPEAEEFEKFHGPILMTTNCIVPPKDSYKDRLYTTGAAGYRRAVWRDPAGGERFPGL